MNSTTVQSGKNRKMVRGKKAVGWIGLEGYLVREDVLFSALPFKAWSSEGVALDTATGHYLGSIRGGCIHHLAAEGC